MRETDNVDIRVGVGSKLGRLGAEGLGFSQQLCMHFEPDDGLELRARIHKSIAHSYVAVFCLVIALGAGCSIVSPSNSDDQVVFGDAYEIREVDPSTGGPRPPAVVDDELVLLVSYSGGCEEHQFYLESSVVGERARVWIRHDAMGDACEAYLTQPLQFELSDRIRGASTLLLLDPNGPPFEL